MSPPVATSSEPSASPPVKDTPPPAPPVAPLPRPAVIVNLPPRLLFKVRPAVMMTSAPFPTPVVPAVTKILPARAAPASPVSIFAKPVFASAAVESPVINSILPDIPLVPPSAV